MNNVHNIKPPKSIPYFDHDKKLSNTIKNSSSRRNISPIKFVYRKIRNIILYRIAYFCPLNGWRVKMHRWRGVNIGKNVYIGQQCGLDNAYPDYIYIEDNVSLAGENTVLAHSNPYAHFAPIVESKVAPIVIKEGAWIGSKAIILLGVTVGKRSIVSAGTVVDKNVPDYALVKGNPMKVVTEFKSLMI
ncbi:serine O-acetyltransferase [Bacteroidia bacterium]|nr:serine O-acetyltransferase [Bacteroidia bacterium]